MERTIADMRTRVLSMADHIAGLLGMLARHIDAVPPLARASIRHATDQIADTQHRLRMQLAHLPPQPEQRLRIMTSLLQAQHGALQQLTLIVEQNLPPAAMTPHPQMHSQPPIQPQPQMQPQPAPVSAGTHPSALQPVDDYWSIVQPGAATAGRALAEAHFSQPWPEEEPVPRAVKKPAAPPKVNHVNRAITAARELAGSRTLLLALAGAGALSAYLLFPTSDASRERARPGNPVRVVVTKDAGSSGAASPDAAQPGRGMTLPSGIVLARPGAEPDEQRLPQAAEPEMMREPGRSVSVGMMVPRAPTSATTVKADPQVVPVEPPPQRFVAVVFTHQDRGAALDQYADLQQRYPSLLGRRKAEAQPVDVSEKGTWHRVVVLPAGPRQGAAGLCDKLQVAGYDRCWIKAY